MTDINQARLKFSLVQIGSMIAAVATATWMIQERLNTIDRKLDRVWTTEDHDLFVYLANQHGAKLPYAAEVRRVKR